MEAIVQKYGNEPQEAYRILPFLGKEMDLSERCHRHPPSMLVYAIYADNLELARLMYKYHPNHFSTGCGCLNVGYAPLVYALSHSNNVEMLEFMHEHTPQATKQFSSHCYFRLFRKKIASSKEHMDVLEWFVRQPQYVAVTQYDPLYLIYELVYTDANVDWAKYVMSLLFQYGHPILKEFLLVKCIADNKKYLVPPDFCVASLFPLSAVYVNGQDLVALERIFNALLEMSGSVTVDIVNGWSLLRLVDVALQTKSFRLFRAILCCPGFTLNPGFTLERVLVVKDDNQDVLGSPKRLQMLQLLLQHNINPFRYDDRGHRLLDCLRLKMYWFGRDGVRYLFYPDEESHQQMVSMLERAMCRWDHAKGATFHQLPARVKGTLLGFAMLNNRNVLPRLPRGVCHMIYAYTVAAHVHDRSGLSLMLKQIPQDKLNELTQAYDFSGNTRVRKRHRVDAYFALEETAREERLKRRRQRQTLPDPIAHVVCTETTSQRSVRVPVSLLKSVFVVGRSSHTDHLNAYPIDLDVSFASLARRVSRNQLLIRYDTSNRRWSLLNMGFNMVQTAGQPDGVHHSKWVTLNQLAFGIDAADLEFTIQTHV